MAVPGDERMSIRFNGACPVCTRPTQAWQRATARPVIDVGFLLALPVEI